MSVTVVLVLGGMLYLGNSLCIPVENLNCSSLSSYQREVAAASDVGSSVQTTAPTEPVIPVSNSGVPAGTGEAVSPNGNKVSFTLSFQINKDMTKYGFNAPIGSQGSDPDIKVHSGDTVAIHLDNPSNSFHAFGIVIDPENPSSVLWNSAYKTPDNPMKPKESGDVTFVAGSPGLYHYICTVPGHAALGMVGNFIVEK